MDYEKMLIFFLHFFLDVIFWICNIIKEKNLENAFWRSLQDLTSVQSKSFMVVMKLSLSRTYCYWNEEECKDVVVD